jgi:hypothetical protein
LSHTSLHPATRDGIPEVLERSKRRLSDVKQLAKDISSAGILVKLFPVDDSNRNLWIVGSPDTIKWTPSNLEDVQEANAKAKASRSAKAGSASKPKVKAKASGQKAGRQKEQRSLAKGGRNMAEQRVQEGHDKSEDTSDEQEEEEEEEEEEEAEEEEEEDDAGEDIEEDSDDSEGEEGLEEEGKQWWLTRTSMIQKSKIMMGTTEHRKKLRRRKQIMRKMKKSWLKKIWQRMLGKKGSKKQKDSRKQ